MCPCQLTRQRCACCVRVLIRQSCGERCGPPKGCDTAGYRLRAQHSPGFVSPAGMSIIYATPPFSAVQSNQVGGIGRSSMPTSVPPASVTCTRGFRRRFADLLPGGGPACSPGTATRPSRTGSNGCLQSVGLLGVPWPAALGGAPGPRRRDRREGPHGQRLTPRCAWESCCYR